MALGAWGADIRKLLLMRVGITFCVGGSAGAVLAGLTSQLAQGLLFGVPPVDPLTIGSVAVLVAGAGSLATILPARRAMAATPATVLRA
jgi:ABC-type antimicrobial peptide transport system permease subunit